MVFATMQAILLSCPFSKAAIYPASKASPAPMVFFIHWIIRYLTPREKTMRKHVAEVWYWTSILYSILAVLHSLCLYPSFSILLLCWLIFYVVHVYDRNTQVRSCLTGGLQSNYLRWFLTSARIWTYPKNYDAWKWYKNQ